LAVGETGADEVDDVGAGVGVVVDELLLHQRGEGGSDG